MNLESLDVVFEAEIDDTAGEIQRPDHCRVSLGVRADRTDLLLRGGDEVRADVAPDGGVGLPHLAAARLRISEPRRTRPGL